MSQLWSIAAPFALLLALYLVGTSTRSAVDRRERERLALRLAAIERKLDAIVAQVGATVPEPRFPEVIALMAQGRKIEAIKIYRDRTGAGLAAAKRAVEDIAVGLPPR